MSNSIKTALAANGAVATLKTIGAFFTGSASMAAEAVHSFADCGNQLLLMWGLKSSKKEADTNHPLGYGMNVYFWSFIVALVLFSLGGVYSVVEGIHKIHDPEPLKYTEWALGILIFGFLAELKSFKVCLAEIREKYPNRSIWWFFKETRSPELLVIFGEDLAALLGLGIAAAFLGIALATGNPIWDGIGSLMVGILLIVVAMFLFLEIKALLIGQSANPEIRRRLHVLLSESSEVEHTYECITYQTGSSALLMIRARMSEKDDAQKLIADINSLEQKISAEFPEFFNQIFVEPDNKFADY